MESYKIIRFFKDGERQIVAEGVTLDEAREHCKSKSTEGENWFDGYQKEEREGG